MECLHCGETRDLDYYDDGDYAICRDEEACQARDNTREVFLGALWYCNGCQRWEGGDWADDWGNETERELAR